MDRDKRRNFLTLLDLQYDTELPIIQRREEIIGQIRENQVIVVCGETGSGKSTQLPKICLEIGRGLNGTIGHTQPRRIAARSIAARIAEELNTPLGQAVGYKVRFDEKINPDSLIKLMTDGILLAESQTDKNFRQYDTIIIDEAHERSLNIDFLLGMMKRLLPHRSDLKLIITSATIDAKRFAEHFTDKRINHGQPIPVIEVSGRTFPIEILYRNIEEQNDVDDDFSSVQERAILAAVDELTQRGNGDILIFLPTERDIFETANSLRKHSANQTEILPLYARLPVHRQQKVFRPSLLRRIVLATNVAESSLTVPGIRYVIDTGTARISRYSARSRTQRLPIEAVSQASADQRAGRCGRIAPGVCIRLYSELDYKNRERYTTPEIQRTNLASVILQTMSLRLGNIETFPFLDPPRRSAISDGYKTLFEIGAIDDQQNLLPIGWKLSKLPVDPRIGRMILAAEENNVLNEMLIIASALEIQDPRERPHEFQSKADAAHEKFLDERSDFIGYLKLWDFFQNVKDQTSRNELRKSCRQNFLSFNRMKEWSDIHLQLLQYVRDTKMKIGQRQSDSAKFYEPLHKSILAGNLSGIAQRDNRFEYMIAGGGKFVLWLGSGIQKHQSNRHQQRNNNNNNNNNKTETAKSTGLPHWIIAGERLETARKYLRTVAQINVDWIEPLAKHLINRVYLEPHWSRETGYVHAYEKVSLFGIVIVPKRRINYGTINPKEARDIFIQSALIEGDIDTTLEFFVHNQKILDEAQKLQDKLRHPDIIKPELVRYQFYQERIPDEVYDQRSLEKFVKQKLSSTEHWKMTLADICTKSADLLKFPDQLGSFDIEYCYAPGEQHDGLTLIVPKNELRQLEPSQLGWLVPGLIEQKIAALLKSLPKEIRRQIVPVTDTAKELATKIQFGQGDLENQICKEVTKIIGRLVVPSDFNREQIPLELRMNIRVLDNEGTTVGESRDFNVLRKELIIPLQDQEKPPQYEHLFYAANKREIRTQIQWLPNAEKLKIYAQALQKFDLYDDLGQLIAGRALRLEEQPITNWEEFERRSELAKREIIIVVQEITKLIVPLLESFHQARLSLEQNKSKHTEIICQDVEEHLKRLTEPGFLVQTPWRILCEFPRYFKAISFRFEKFRNGGELFDRQATLELQKYWKQYTERLELHQAAGIIDTELTTFRWMLEEYRVSLFAQRLGTSIKISPQRLNKQFDLCVR
ncbi:MAG: ATP-dependent RNA helicase HrpA [Planctomycetaceae bacterium]|jgi:ATP-dependent helicase HrpA|nr:ATP-dependent RNA helicase HrpA [Planctomycetaceae bacterium]